MNNAEIFIYNDVEFLDLSVNLTKDETIVLSYDKSEGNWYGYMVTDSGSDMLDEDVTYEMTQLESVQNVLNSLNFYSLDFC